MTPKKRALLATDHSPKSPKSPKRQKLSGPFFEISSGTLMYRGNSSSKDPTSSSDDKCSKATNNSGVFCAFSAEVAQTYGLYIHSSITEYELVLFNMSTADGVRLFHNKIASNSVMSESDTAKLLVRFDEAYVLSQDGIVTRFSCYENDGPLFCGIQSLFSFGVFGDIDGIGNNVKIGNFHPEAYLFSRDSIVYKEVFVNTDKASRGDAQARLDKEKRLAMKVRPRFFDSNDESDDDKPSFVRGNLFG